MKNENEEELSLASHCPAPCFLPECQQKVEMMDGPVFESLPGSFHFMLPPSSLVSVLLPPQGTTGLLGCSYAWEEIEDEGEMGARGLKAGIHLSPLPNIC